MFGMAPRELERESLTSRSESEPSSSVSFEVADVAPEVFRSIER